MYNRNRREPISPVLILIAVNVVILIATFVNEDVILARFGFREITFLQQPWTVFTSIFVHAGIWHLASNMLTLYFFGTFLIMLLGDTRFLLIYFIGGVMGNLCFMLLAPSPFATVVGASGALYAVGGTLAVMRPTVKVYIFGVLPVPLWAAVIVGFLIITPGIAWQAHLGGLLFGLAIGWYYRKKEIRGRL